MIVSSGFHLVRGNEKQAFAAARVAAARNGVTVSAVNAYGVHGFGIDVSRKAISDVVTASQVA